MTQDLDGAAARIKKQQADACLQAGDLEQARGCYAEACRLDPTDSRAWVMLGNLHSQLGAADQAEAAYRQAIERDPQCGEAYQFLGNLIAPQSRYVEAVACYRQALRIKPHSIPAHINLAATLSLQGELDQALDVYRSALEHDPDCRKAILGIAHIHERQGDFEPAYRRLLPFLERGDMDFEAAMIFAALARPLGRGDEAVALLESMLRQEHPRLDDEQRTVAHFRLGALYDAKGEYKYAFEHFRHGNEIKAGRWPFDARAHADYVTSIIDTYTPGFTAAAPRATLTSERPVFIVGMPRSGTSLVEQILASHPEVFGAGELEELPAITNDLPDMVGSESPYPLSVQGLTPAVCDSLAQRYLDRLGDGAPAGARRITDKLPANFLHLGLIGQLFPHARVIHCVRDPMDTCLSCYFQNFSPVYAYTFQLAPLGAFYRQYRRIMSHWREVSSLPFLEVRYEDLVADQEGVSRALVEFCGLDWDERCLRFHETRRVVATASYDQVRQPMYRRSVQRWRRYAEYLEPLRRALEHGDDPAPSPAADHREQARALLQAGDAAGARELLTDILGGGAPDPRDLYLLGRANAALGRRDEAANRYVEALRAGPADPGLLKELGESFLELDRLDEAAASFTALLDMRPTAYAHYSLANVYTRQQRLDDAVRHYRQALTLEPGRAEIYNNLGNALRYQREYRAAADAYLKALELAPEHPMAHEAHANLGTVLLVAGHFERARTAFQQALELNPASRRAVAGLADLLGKEGKFEQAYELLRPLLETGRADANIAIVLATVCRTLGRCDEAVTLMERLLAGQGETPVDAFEQISLHFMLARLYDASREYDKAFAHCRQANDLTPGRFDMRQFDRYIDALIATYSDTFMTRAPRATHGSQRPLFILGMPRSGTTLVEQILASHPAVFGAGELEELHRIVDDLPRELSSPRPYPACMDALTAEACERLAGRYLDYLDTLAPPDSLRVIDKMPSNFLHLGLINLLFPQARVIHCVRDPMDTCLSCYFQNFDMLTYTCDLGQLGAYYRSYARLMTHWRPRLDIPVLEVRYEDMVADQEGVSRAVVEFCGLDWDERCLRFHETPRLVATASYDQVRRPMYGSSVGKWRHYADYLGPLEDALGGKTPPAA